MGIAALALYPLIAWLGLKHGSPRATGFLLVILVALRLPWIRRGGAARMGLSLAAIPLSVSLLTAVTGHAGFLLWSPALTNALLLAYFAFSLKRGPSVAEAFARLKHGQLTPEAVAYCRKATVAWCLFFVLNGLIAAATAWHGDRDIWAAYNGGLCYVLLALMAGGEFWIRQRVQAKQAH